MAKQYESVSELAKDLTDDRDFLRDLEEELADKSLARTLFTIRCRGGVTQAEMADRLGYTQSRISKLENGGLDRIKVSDLVAYAKALGLQTSISFHKKMTAVEWVKFHAFQIKDYLDQLAGLAHKDEGIFKGVRDFYGETLFNFLRLFEQSAAKLPRGAERRRGQEPLLEVSAPQELVEEDRPQPVGK